MTMQKIGSRITVSIPQAIEVYVLGEFNNWSTVATPLAKVGGDNWEFRPPTNLDPLQLAFFVWDRGASFGRFIFNNTRDDKALVGG